MAGEPQNRLMDYVPMQDHDLYGGNLTPSGRAEPSYGPMDFIIPGGVGAIVGGGMNLLSRAANAGLGRPDMLKHRMFYGVPAAAAAAFTGANIPNQNTMMDAYRRDQNSPGYNPSVPPDLVNQGAYDDGSMYGGQMPPPRRLPYGQY